MAGLESEPSVKLKLTTTAYRGEYSADVVSQIACWTREHGISIPSQRQGTLRVTGDCKIRMIEQVVGFHSKFNSHAFRHLEGLLQGPIKFRERGTTQAISPSISELTGSRY